MAEVKFHPDARHELVEAIGWYIVRSQRAATGFAQAIDRAVERIGEAPERYPVTRRGRRRFVLLEYPYDVIYRIVDSDVEIVAVAHHSRRPGYWRKR